MRIGRIVRIWEIEPLEEPAREPSQPSEPAKEPEPVEDLAETELPRAARVRPPFRTG